METRKITPGKNGKERYQITLTRKQLDVLRALAWTVQNTIKENDDVAEEYEENLKYFGHLNRETDYPVAGLKLTFRKVIDGLEPVDREREFTITITNL